MVNGSSLMGRYETAGSDGGRSGAAIAVGRARRAVVEVSNATYRRRQARYLRTVTLPLPYQADTELLEYTSATRTIGISRSCPRSRTQSGGLAGTSNRSPEDIVENNDAQSRCNACTSRLRIRLGTARSETCDSLRTDSNTQTDDRVTGTYRSKRVRQRRTVSASGGVVSTTASSLRETRESCS